MAENHWVTEVISPPKKMEVVWAPTYTVSSIGAHLEVDIELNVVLKRIDDMFFVVILF